MRFLSLAFIFLGLSFASQAAKAEDIVASLSKKRISITTGFDGSEILIFGAIRRETNVPEDTKLDVIVTVEGPRQMETIRKKARRGGIWINVEANVLGLSPSFYSVITSREILDELPALTDQAWSITANERILPSEKGNPAREALLRIRTNEGLYKTREGDVELIEDTLFQTALSLPENVTEGDYRTRIYLLRAGKVIDSYDTVIFVQKVGLGRFLHSLAFNNSLIYGVLAVFLAVIFGWAASEIFRILRRR